MKANRYFVGVILLTLLGCSKSHSGMVKGTIQNYTGLDGCGMVIELENGTTLEPTNLNSFQNEVSIADEQKVWVKYHSVEGASICMVGQIVQLDALEER